MHELGPENYGIKLIQIEFFDHWHSVMYKVETVDGERKAFSQSLPDEMQRYLEALWKAKHPDA